MAGERRGGLTLPLAGARQLRALIESDYLAPEYAVPLARARSAAGMFAPLGVAHEENGGYHVSGSYPFGSGCGHAEFMGGAAMVMRDGEMPPFDGALPQIRAFIVPMDRVVLKRNWDVMGLCGTGSFDFEVPEQHVDASVVLEHVRATRAAASWVVRVAKAATTFAWESAGSVGIRTPNRLQRCFRDMCVGAGHMVFDDRNYVEFVKPGLGLEPLPF